MRGVYTTVLTAGLIVLAASPAYAQPRPGFGPPGGAAPTAAQLVANDKVAAELKITDAQKADIKTASDKVRDKYKDDIDKARANMDRDKMGELRKAQNEESDKAILAVLKPEQAKRLNQIVVQAAGLNAFSKDDVAAALKLTDKQKQDVKDTQKDLQDDIRDVFQDAGMDPEKRQAAQKKVQTLRTDAFDKVVASLTDDQKKTWKDLTGDKFDVPQVAFGPGAGPGFPGPGVGPGFPGFGPPGQGFTVTSSMLLRSDKVQAEIKVTGAQKDDIKKEGDTVRAKYRDDMDKARSDMDFAKIGELMKSQGEDMDKALAGILKSDQSKRLKQIVVQASGVRAFSRDDVQSALKLTDAQKKDVDSAETDVQKSIGETMQNAFQGGFDPDKMAEARKKIQGITTDAVDKIVKGLTDDQKKAWKDLTGDKFEIDLGELFRGPGGLGRPPGPGRDRPNP
jgi:hypothetical protein